MARSASRRTPSTSRKPTSETRVRAAKPAPSATPAEATTRSSDASTDDLEALLSGLRRLLTRHHAHVLRSEQARRVWAALLCIDDAAQKVREAPPGSVALGALQLKHDPSTARGVAGLVVGPPGTKPELMVTERAFDETACELSSCMLLLHDDLRDVQDMATEARFCLHEAIRTRGDDANMRGVAEALGRLDRRFYFVTDHLICLANTLTGRRCESLSHAIGELTLLVDNLGGSELPAAGSVDTARRSWLARG